MKKSLLKTAVVALAFSVAMLPSSFAATQSTVVPVSASISGALTLSVNLFSVNPTTFAETAAANMGFGALTKNTFGGMDATRYFKAYVVANSQGLPYTLTQNGTAVSNGTTTLPNGACKVTPSYEPTANGGAPLVGTVGTPGTWVGTRTLYTSNSAGDTRALSVYYGLVGDPATGAGNFIPDNQQAGNYSGTVTFTVTTA